MTKHLKGKKTLHEIWAKCAAVSGWSFRSIAQSESLGQLLFGAGYEPPSDPKSVKSYVMAYANEIKSKTISEIELLMSQNYRFALSFDEWTSLKNIRYLNLVLQHNSSMVINLGLFRIDGDANAKNLFQLVKDFLSSFKIDLYCHIIAIMTDGCHTMTRIGKDASPVIQQLCYAHGLQLAVLDALYKENTAIIPVQNQENRKSCNQEIPQDDDDDSQAYLRDDDDNEAESSESKNSKESESD